jgi:transposase
MTDIQSNLNLDWTGVPVITGEVDKLMEVKNIIKRLTYPQDWIAYNAAQTKERILSEQMLLEILENFPQKELRMKGGRYGTPLYQRVYCMFVYTYTGHSSRRCISELTMAKERGVITGVPHFNTVLNYFSNKSATEVLKKILIITSLPLRGVEDKFAVDGTGFSTSVFKRWFDIRTQSADLKRCWKKAHAIVGVNTQIITSLEITEGTEHDSPYMLPLVKETQKFFDMKEVLGDKGYIGKENLDGIAELGIIPYIPFKSNHKRNGKGPIWAMLFDYFKKNQEDFLKHYHQRSKVETCFSMIKRKFNSNLKTKKDLSQVNEILMKCICHNLAVLVQESYELGLDLDLSSCAQLVNAQ